MDSLKQAAALRAIEEIQANTIIGVGTGTTVHYFIEALAKIKHRIDACVASSKATEEKLRARHIPVIDLNAAGEVALYVDGADEITPNGEMIKGGGGALVREKIIATNAKRFVCIADESKWVKRLGEFPLPVEVIPMARSYVARALVKMGGNPEYRQGFVSDNGNVILDVHHLNIQTPLSMELAIKSITGVVDCGLFAHRCADSLILATQNGVELHHF